MPVARSLAIDYAHDATIYQPRYQNQYLFGAAILVPPVAEGAEFVKVYLPALPSGTGWYDLHSDTYFPAGEHIVEVRKERFPLFIKGGSIIPMQSLVQSMSERPADILELHIYAGNSETTFDYYEDDASTYAYQSGAYFKRSITYSPQHKTLRLSAVEGSYESQFRRLRVYFHGFKKLTVPTEMIDYQYVPPVSSFDPFYAVEVTDMSCKAVQSLVIEHERGEIVVKI
jgi:alpha-glucosidase